MNHSAKAAATASITIISPRPNGARIVPCMLMDRPLKSRSKQALPIAGSQDAFIRDLYFRGFCRASNLYIRKHNFRLLKLEAVMLDTIFLGAGLAFFAAAIGYTLVCEKL